MGRGSFALSSCVAAVPAGILATLIVMEGFLKHFGNMSPLLMFLVGATLGLAGFVVLIPFGILVFGRPKKVKPAADKAAAAAAAADGSSSAVMAADSEDDVLATSGEAQVVDAEMDSGSGEYVSSGAMIDEEIDATTAFSSPVDEVGDDSVEDAIIDDEFGEISDLDEIGDEVILEDEDDEPKSKKKKR